MSWGTFGSASGRVGWGLGGQGRHGDRAVRVAVAQNPASLGWQLLDACVGLGRANRGASPVSGLGTTRHSTVRVLL